MVTKLLAGGDRFQEIVRFYRRDLVRLDRVGQVSSRLSLGMVQGLSIRLDLSPGLIYVC